MDERVIRIRLIETGLQLKDLSKLTGIDYDRIVKLVNGYRRPRPGEVHAIASALGIPESSLQEGGR
jgi:transcriptional regulator with XRE-family HTH domain